MNQKILILFWTKKFLTCYEPNKPEFILNQEILNLFWMRLKKLFTYTKQNNSERIADKEILYFF